MLQKIEYWQPFIEKNTQYRQEENLTSRDGGAAKRRSRSNLQKFGNQKFGGIGILTEEVVFHLLCNLLPESYDRSRTRKKTGHSWK
ncbi:unnamed protein product [Danaus chrysippus]|uniref:(African queen) hypothetical protein n=1 Tax=Danaus chrysippus TaxID=151541 RepID=A0A8J2QPJ7_9NEOP|nr:unnamed protein product [Danaus chrysippus]